MPIDTKSNIDEYLNRKIEGINKAISAVLHKVGEDGRNAQIIAHKYNNQTGNLESSTGYVVVQNGNLNDVGGFDGAQDGSANGKSFAIEKATAITEGNALVAVAGMDYAKYVSDMGLDVLNTYELTIEKELPKYLKMITNKING